MDQAAGEVTDMQDPVAEDPEVVVLVDGIDATRDEMTVTVEEIGDRLDPRNIVADAKETVRDATVGKVEQMTSQASDMVAEATDTARQAGSGIADIISRNPVPAAMIGIGIGWLAMSARSSGATRFRGDGMSSGYASGYASGGAWASGDRGYAGAGSSRPGAMLDQAGQVVDDVRSRVGELADEVPYRAQMTAQDLGSDAGRIYRENPLAVGAIAIAVGTAAGLALPPTQLERQAIGQPARQVLDRVEETATDAIGKVEQTARDAEQQARAADTGSQSPSTSS